MDYFNCLTLSPYLRAQLVLGIPQMEVKSDVNHRTVCTPSATAQYYFLTERKVM